MLIVLLVLHSIALFLLGKAIMRRWFERYPPLLQATGSWLLGVSIGVPLTYVCACVLSFTREPMAGALIVATAVMTSVYARLHAVSKEKIHKKNMVTWSLWDVGILMCSIGFSTWLMTKTLHGDALGQVFVGSNNVFDFGMALGLVRSMGWGDNIPFMSPFFAGLPMVYHFFFAFWASLWVYAGVSTVWAINIPSIFSFTLLLLMVYYLPQILAKQKPWVGAMAVLFAITNSSLAFWKLAGEKGFSLQFLKDVWQLPTYPYAGPFDGSTISIFITLNSYTNQRHLALGIAVALFIFMTSAQVIGKRAWMVKHSVLFGFLTGILLGWNIAIFLFLLIPVVGLLIFYRQWRGALVYGLTAMGVAFVCILPLLPFLYNAFMFLKKLTGGRTGAAPTQWSAVEYLWQNLGLLPFMAGVGLWTLAKKVRHLFSFFVLSFLLTCLVAISGRGFEQKAYSFYVLVIDVLAAIAIGWLWQGKKWITKLVTVGIVVVLTISGIVNLFPIKNEFAFPLVNKDMLSVSKWIRSETPKDAVFVSYADIIDPVALSGRKNYLGFFGNIGWSIDRSTVVRAIYEGDKNQADASHISYILVPKWQKNGFPYTVKEDVLKAVYHLVYEDERYIVFAVR